MGLKCLSVKDTATTSSRTAVRNKRAEDVKMRKKTHMNYGPMSNNCAITPR